MRRTLSANASTFCMKIFWPALTAIAFAFFTYALWHGRFHVSENNLSPQSNDAAFALVKWLFPIIGIASTIFGIWYGKRFKYVAMDDDALYVSSFKSEIRIPFSEIENCWFGLSWTSKRSAMPVINIALRTPTIFGNKIVFLAKESWNPSHSLVAELRQRCDQARGINNH